MLARPSNLLIHRLQQHFSKPPQDAFCILIGADGEDRLTWPELEQLSLQYSATLEEAGIGQDDLVLIFLRHSRHLYGAFFGTMLAGAIPSYMPCTSPRQDPDIYWAAHEALLRRTQPAAIIASAATLAEMQRAGLDTGATKLINFDEISRRRGTIAARADTAIALLQHSSGTTGLKKGVALAYDAIVRQLESYGSALSIAQEDVIVSWLPLYHDMGLMACCLLPAYFGLPIIHIDAFTWLAKPDLLLQALAERHGTLVWLPNFAFEHMARTCRNRASLFDLSKVRAFINCSEPCKATSFDRFIETFAVSGVRPEQLQCCYAMAETVFAISQTELGKSAARLKVDPHSLAPGATPRRVAGDGQELLETGKPITGIEVSIYDEARRLLPQPAVGEIGLRGNFLFSGYNKDPQRTAERLVDGTYFSRDLGFVFEGRLYVLGRADDLIIVNGRNLYAHEIEAELSSVAGLKPGRAVAVPSYNDRVGSQTLVIIAERKNDALEPDDQIRREIVRRIHSTFEVTPWRIHMVAEGWLIKTTSGKISRAENLARLQTLAVG